MAKLITLALLGVFATVFVAVSAEDDNKLKQMFKEAADACKDQISEDIFNALKEDHKLDNEEANKFRVCMYSHIEFMKDGKFDIEAIKAKVDENVEVTEKALIIKGLFENCAKSAEEAVSDIDAASIFTKCVKKVAEAGQE